MHFTSATILSALMAMPLASGLGINCRGSTGCTGSSQTMTKFRDAMQNIDPGWIFADGQQIICNANHVSFLFDFSPPSPYQALRRLWHVLECFSPVTGSIVLNAHLIYTDLRLFPEPRISRLEGATSRLERPQ